MVKVRGGTSLGYTTPNFDQPLVTTVTTAGGYCFRYDRCGSVRMWSVRTPKWFFYRNLAANSPETKVFLNGPTV